MSLWIRRFDSEKEWKYCYHMLHVIRYTAAKSSGFQGTFEMFEELEKRNDTWKEWPEFYQLMHFCDAEGVLVPGYILENVDIDKAFYLGNSETLAREISLLRTRINHEPELCDEEIKIAIDELYDLLMEEEPGGIVVFR